MADHTRARKLAERIQVIVAKRIEKGIRDPRLGFVTITDVNVTGDLQHASIFYTVYGSNQEREDSAKALEAAKGMFRTEVGKNITSRLTPTIEFIADGIPENAKNIDSLLRTAQQRDEQTKHEADAAVFAGDDDPYVKPRERQAYNPEDFELDGDPVANASSWNDESLSDGQQDEDENSR